MPALSPFDYAIIRVVPSIERGECLNVGVVLFCRTRRFLDARVDLETRRLALLAPALDREDIRRHLELIPRLCAGGQQAGPIGLLAMPERFHWLVAPRSTIIQPSQVHSGLCADPAATLERLFAALVLVDAPPV